MENPTMLQISHIPPKLPEVLVQNTELVLIGVFLICMLFGVLFVQVYLYWMAFTDDRWFTKTAVYVIAIMEAVQTILIIVDSFHTLAKGFDNPESAIEVNSSWLTVPAMGGWVAFMVQGIYGHRLYMVSKSKLLYSIIIMLSFLQLGGAIVVSFETKTAGIMTEILGTKRSVVTGGIWVGSSALCDITIAIGMTYHMKTRDYGTPKTHEFLTRIIILSVGTGTVTVTLSLVTLVLANVPTKQLLWIPSSVIIGKAYANSIMVALNSRLKVTHNSCYPLWEEEKTSLIATSDRWHISRGILFTKSSLETSTFESEEPRSGAEADRIL